MERQDVVIRNANVVTLNPRQPRAKAVAVRGGRIAAVGSSEAVAPYTEGVLQLDLGGKTVVPGLIDSHLHFTWTGMEEVALDFSVAETVEEVQTLIREAAAETEPGQLIFGMGLNTYRFLNRQPPTAADLDTAAADHPVFIIGVTGHYSLANTESLKLLDLPADTPGQEASGSLRGQANNAAIGKMTARFVAEQGLERVQRAAAERAASVGLTTVHALEGENRSDDPAVRALLAAAPSLPVRVVLWAQTTDPSEVLKLGLPRIGGCILLDGDFGPHTAALLEPYADQPDSRGTLYYTQEEVDRFVEAAHRAGLQIAMHAVGDRAAQQALDAYERVLARWPRPDHRHRIEHFEIYYSAPGTWRSAWPSSRPSTATSAGTSGSTRSWARSGRCAATRCAR